MKTRQLIRTLLSALVVSAIVGITSCDDEKNDIPLVFSAHDAKDWRDDNDDVPYEGVTIKLYKTEEDYLFDENVITTLQTNSNGEAYYNQGKNDILWFRAIKNGLTNQRFGSTCTFYGNDPNINCGRYAGFQEYFINSSNSEFQGKRFIPVRLATIPSQLEITVFNQGVPVADAMVTLYASEQDYLDDIPFFQRIGFENPSYPNKNDYGPIGHFRKNTKDGGKVLFKYLEPKTYWFRITKDGKNNSTTIIKTSGNLSENYDVITSIEVGIQ